MKIFRRSTATLIEGLARGSDGVSRARAEFHALEGLPPPVERYLKHVLRDDQRLIRIAHLKQQGILRTGVRGSRWLDFEAQQVVAPLTPGFVWDARVSIMPLLHVRVRDAYVHGAGSGRVTLLSVIPVARGSGARELNSGALHRYLAEAAWYPTALLPTSTLSWSPIDGTRALATLTDAGQTVSLEFRFNEAGEIAGIYSPGRWGTFECEYRQVPWEGHFSNYQERNGMLMPTRGEVGWYTDGQWQKVWSGSVLDAALSLCRDSALPFFCEVTPMMDKLTRVSPLFRTGCGALLIMALLPCAAAAQGTGTRYINPKALVKPTGYTHLVIAPDGRTVYIAGQVAFDSAGKVVGVGDFAAQAEQVFRNLQQALESVGGSMADLVKTTTFITDIKHVPALREVRARHLAKAQPPANTLVAVSSLARPELLIEIEGVALLQSIVRR